ncbi:unnamed protein product, partial [Meganyctiphanes norvegica]
SLNVQKKPMMSKSTNEASHLIVKSETTKCNEKQVNIDKDGKSKTENYGSFDSQPTSTSKWGNDRNCIVEIVNDACKENESIDPKTASSTSLIINNDDDEICVFCLDPGDLIRFCKCSVAAHKKCVLEYVTYPGNHDASCCLCRRKLEYKVYDEETNIKGKYVLFLCMIILSYILVAALTMIASIEWVLPQDMDITVSILVTVNLGALAALFFAGCVSITLYCCAPKYKDDSSYSENNRESSSSSSSSRTYSSNRSFFWFPFWFDCSSGNSSSSCGAYMAVVCLLIVALFIIIGTTNLVFMQIMKYHKCFSLKSKTDIRFKEERIIV